MTKELGQAMKKYAAPRVIFLLFSALYNIMNQIFIAKADYLGFYKGVTNTEVFPFIVF